MRHTGTSERPADEQEIQAAEARLGTTLPPSLRAFLAGNNGWGSGDTPYGLLSAAQLRWAHDPSHDLVDAWSSFEEIVEVIEHCLVVLDSNDGRYALLDPVRASADGEWPAYDWRAGDGENPRPFPSFSALVSALAQEGVHHPAGSGRPSS